MINIKTNLNIEMIVTNDNQREKNLENGIAKHVQAIRLR